MSTASVIAPTSSHRRAELAYAHKDGTFGDALIHEDILTNPEAEAYFSACVIREAMEQDGLSREQAVQLYGLKH